MKRAILLLVVVVGGAFYLGWFTFTTDNSGQTEHVHIVINKDKIQQDEARAVQKLHSLEQQAEAQAQTNPAETTGEPALPVGRSADRRRYSSQQPNSYFPSEQPEGLPAESGYQPLSQQEYAPGQQMPQEVDPYEVPERPRAVNRPSGGAASDSFSRGFQ